MTPTVDLRPLTPRTCSKPGCIRLPLQRHHKGCELMWVRHFRHRKRTKKWRAFRERYFLFLPEDCADLCPRHHKQIHEKYYLIIGAWALRLGPCKTWTWVQAEELMQELRDTFDVWVGNKAVSL